MELSNILDLNMYNRNQNFRPAAIGSYQEIQNQTALAVTQKLAFQELSFKVCISRLPPGASDEFVLKLLASCELATEIKEWKRYKTASGEPKDGGIADFHSIEGVFTCLKFIHNMKIGENILMAKSNQKTQGYLNEIREAKRAEYLKTSSDDAEVLIEKEDLADALTNGVLPYEEDLLSGGSYQTLKDCIQKVLEDGDTLLQPQVVEKVNPEIEKPIDPLLKYKEHERERQRERKIKDMEHNK